MDNAEKSILEPSARDVNESPSPSPATSFPSSLGGSSIELWRKDKKSDITKPNWKIFVINLDKSPERLEFVKNQLSQYSIEFERSNGVVADTLSQEEIQKVYSLSKNKKQYIRSLHLGQIACYLAHAKVWREILAQNLDYAIILEDDVSVDEKIIKQLEFLEKTYGKWDYVRLQENSKLKKIFHEVASDTECALVEYLNLPGNTLAQAVSKEAAEKMLNRLFPFGCPVDTQLQYVDKIGVEVLSLIPSGFHERRGDSVLESYNKNKKKYHHLFIRQKLSSKAYLNRITYFIKKYGLLTVIKEFFKLPVRKPTRGI